MQFDANKANNLIIISKEEVPDFWHVIQPGLKYMVEEKRNPDGWTPKIVFDALYQGKASCVFTSIFRSEDPKLGYKNRDAAIEDSCGFGIVQVLDGPDGKAFHIWIAVSNDTTNKAQAPSILTTFHDEVWQLAKDAGCKYITFGSNQKWWADLAPRFGFEVQEVKYRVEVK